MHYIFIYNLKVNAWNISVNVVDAFHKDGCVMEFRTARIALTKSNVQEKVRYHLYSTKCLSKFKSDVLFIRNMKIQS